VLLLNTRKARLGEGEGWLNEPKNGDFRSGLTCCGGAVREQLRPALQSFVIFSMVALIESSDSSEHSVMNYFILAAIPGLQVAIDSLWIVAIISFVCLTSLPCSKSLGILVKLKILKCFSLLLQKLSRK
jgi:hypothetical protein